MGPRVVPRRVRNLVHCRRTCWSVVVGVLMSVVRELARRNCRMIPVWCSLALSYITNIDVFAKHVCDSAFQGQTPISDICGCTQVPLTLFKPCGTSEGGAPKITNMVTTFLEKNYPNSKPPPFIITATNIQSIHTHHKHTIKCKSTTDKPK